MSIEREPDGVSRKINDIIRAKIRGDVRDAIRRAAEEIDELTDEELHVLCAYASAEGVNDVRDMVLKKRPDLED